MGILQFSIENQTLYDIIKPNCRDSESSHLYCIIICLALNICAKLKDSVSIVVWADWKCFLIFTCLLAN